MKSFSPRKTCPTCGHPNRFNAKVCTQCGHAFILVSADGVMRKTCSTCGHANRLAARVCSQCGRAFPDVRPVQLLRGKRWCPQCGAPRRATAKVCSQCGFRFTSTPKETPIVPAPKPAITLPPALDVSPTLPRRKSHTGLEGEPSPYITNDELNRLLGSGPYSPNLIERMAYRVTKKDNS
jgi:predicted amidophosphoribosyltransferase